MENKLNKMLYVAIVSASLMIGIFIGNYTKTESNKKNSNKNVEFYADQRRGYLLIHCDANCKNAGKGIYYFDPNNFYDNWGIFDGDYYKFCPVCIDRNTLNNIKDRRYYNPKK